MYGVAFPLEFFEYILLQFYCCFFMPKILTVLIYL